MSGRRPRSSGRRWPSVAAARRLVVFLTLAAGGALTGCAGAPGVAPPPSDGWRVLDRAGAVRLEAPGDAGWRPVGVEEPAPAGARAQLGARARLALRTPGVLVEADARSAFALPAVAPMTAERAAAADDDDAPAVAERALRQASGALAYEIARPDWFAVLTPWLGLDARDAAFRVLVDQEGTAVMVDRGSVRVWTLDGRQSDRLGAGGRARIAPSPLSPLESAPDARAWLTPAPSMAARRGGAPVASSSSGRDRSLEAAFARLETMFADLVGADLRSDPPGGGSIGAAPSRAGSSDAGEDGLAGGWRGARPAAAP